MKEIVSVIIVIALLALLFCLVLDAMGWVDITPEDEEATEEEAAAAAHPGYRAPQLATSARLIC